MVENFIKNNERKVNIFKAVVLFSILLFTLIAPFFVPANIKSLKSTSKSYLAQNEENYIYLSDINYVKNMSSSGWGNILYDTTSSGSKITLKVENNSFSFDKGIWAHATSTVVYDLTDYSDYDYFTSYIGLNNTAAASSNGVKYFIYTSADGKSWDLKTEENPNVAKPGANATFIKIDIKGAKYLKLYANSNGSNGNDHSVYADAKLIKSSYTEPGEDLVPTLIELDEKIKTEFANANLETNEEYELTLLKREFINRAGNFALRRFLSQSETNMETYKWLTENVDNLRLYMLGGTPDGGSYYNSLTQLARLYSEYKDDFTNEELLNNKWYQDMTYGDLYKKMAITLSLTHSQRVGLWMQAGATENQSDAVRRYQIYKDLHKDGKFIATKNADGTPNVDITPWFESLHVEEMRFVLGNALDDEETLWLNEYTQTYIDKYPNQVWKYLTPHPYMAYVYPNYGNPIFHDPEKKDYWDEKFGGIFSKYNVSYSREGYKLYKVWMNFRNEYGTGAVCGGISKTGSNIRTSHGIPATVIGQPGHAALLYYTKDAQGRGYWGIDNDVSGWTLSEKSERLLLGWGNANTNYARGSYQVVYMALSQEAINDYDNLVKSEEKVMLAKVYQEDLNKQEEVYRSALKTQSINIDAWLGLINVYNANENKTEEEFYNLAEELATSLKYFPLPMQQLTNLIKPKLTSVQNSYKFTLLQTRILTEASTVPNNTVTNYYVYQPSLTRLEANFLLGKIDKTIATFSFDGDDAGKIVLAKRYDGVGIRWDYSIDGKKTWKEVYQGANDDHKYQLSKEEINSITAENDIYFHIVGTDYSESNIYKIDILNAAAPNVYLNDLENKVIGATSITEWRMEGSNTWTSYASYEPDLTGNKTVYVRTAATKNYMKSPEIQLKFTEDSNNIKEKYVSISRMKVKAFSTEEAGKKEYATNAIDGRLDTMWHSLWNGSDTEKYIILELDTPIYLSALEYYPRQDASNGRVLSAGISISMDGENFEEVVEGTNWANNGEVKKVVFDGEKQAKYIKLVGKKTYGSYISAALINIYENGIKAPTAEIEYDNTSLTTKDVTAKLVNPSEEITITNNDGKDTYVFTQNGNFTFEFVNKDGIKGHVTARVYNIDKELPTASIKYSITSLTNKNVVATLIDESEEIEITNNNGKRTYTFTENGTFEFTYKDKAGNTNKTVATVSFIDKTSPYASVTYSTTSSTDNPVTATLTNESEEIIILNNDGKRTYTFTENGTFEFIYKDIAGNTNKTLASVTWITNNKKNNNRVSKQKIINKYRKNNISTEYKIYNRENISVKIPSSILKENVTLKLNELVLNKAVQEKIGGKNEYFELYFENSKGNRKDFNTTMKMVVNIDSNRKLLGIYEIGENNVIEKLDYEDIGNNQIQINVNHLGKYVLSYEVDDTDKSKLDNKNNQIIKDNQNIDKSKAFPIIIGCLISLVVVSFGFMLKIKRGKN